LKADKVIVATINKIKSKMKKPVACVESVPPRVVKMICKLQKENDPGVLQIHSLGALEFARSAAYHQEMRVAKLIQEINK
jgi:hypothetical protein